MDYAFTYIRSRLLLLFWREDKRLSAGGSLAWAASGATEQHLADSTPQRSSYCREALDGAQTQKQGMDG